MKSNFILPNPAHDRRFIEGNYRHPEIFNSPGIPVVMNDYGILPLNISSLIKGLYNKILNGEQMMIRKPIVRK